MFVEQGFKKDNKFGKYLLGSLLTFIASQLGTIPLLVAIAIKSVLSGTPFPASQNQVMSYLDSNLTLFLVLISFAFGLFALYFIVVKYHKQTFLSLTTSRPKVDWNRILFSFLIWSVLSVIFTYMEYYMNPKDYVFNFHLIPFFILFVVATLFIPIQTSTEEYVFRGYLMQGFGNLSKNKWFPLVMTSVIFGGMHIANPEVEKMGYIIMVYYIGTGFFLGIVALMDEGLELSLGFHAANNLIGALLVTSDWSVFQTNAILRDVSNPIAGYEVLLPVFVIFPLLLFIFSKKYGWTNWKEKLTGTINSNNILTIDNNE
ncbi:MAG: CPBP family intramembrane metalloprotease [Flavobacterium sp.]|nr:CPBP family intramembrane metalloprotease [Flavobacterium sp.]